MIKQVTAPTSIPTAHSLMDAGKCWLFWGATALISYFPLILLVGWNIWGPSTMVHEVFETNFFSFQANLAAYFESYTGHFFHVLLLYPIQFVFFLFFRHISFFEHAQWFCLAFYFLHGSILLLILRQIWLSSLRIVEKFALLAIPATALWLLRESTLGLFINYHKGGVIISLLIAFGVIAWNAGAKNFKISPPVLGMASAIVMGTKLSWLFVFVPWIVFLSVADEANLKQQVRFIARAVAWGLGTYALLFATFFFFKPSSIQQSLHVLADYVAAGSVRQQQPFFWSEISNFFSLNSYYAGFHLYAAIWIAALLGLVGSLFFTRNKHSIPILVLTGISTIFLARMLVTRAAVGTMQDIELFMAMSCVINWAIVSRAHGTKIIQHVLFAALWLIPIGSMAINHPQAYLSTLRHNSDLAREMEQTLTTHQTLPIYLYLPDFSQPYLFSSSVTYHYFGQKYPERFKYAPVRDSAPIVPSISPNIFVVAEYIEGPARTAEALKEWPEMYPTFATLRLAPHLAKRVKQLGSACKVYQYREVQDRQYLVNYYYYPTRVTVCVDSMQPMNTAKAF